MRPMALITLASFSLPLMGIGNLGVAQGAHYITISLPLMGIGNWAVAGIW